MVGPSRASSIIVLVALLAVAGHGCALPLHAHAPGADAADHGHPAERSFDPHVGACEAAAVRAMVPCAVPAATAVPAAAPRIETVPEPIQARQRVPAASTARFLLHASLLI